MKIANELESEIIVESGLEAFTFQTALGLVLFEDGKGELTANQNQGMKIRPAILSAKLGKHGRIAHQPTLAHFDPPMPFIHRFSIIVVVDETKVRLSRMVEPVQRMGGRTGAVGWLSRTGRNRRLVGRSAQRCRSDSPSHRWSQYTL